MSDGYDIDQDSGLDPGIREVVRVLRQHGVETFESCQGGDGHASPDAMVRFAGSMWAGYHAFSVAMEHGMPVLSLAYRFSVVNGHLESPCWVLTFADRVREMKW